MHKVAYDRLIKIDYHLALAYGMLCAMGNGDVYELSHVQVSDASVAASTVQETMDLIHKILTRRSTDAEA